MLGDQQEAELLRPVGGVLVGGEVAALTAPGRERLDHTVDDLANAGLALRAAGAASEVLLSDDVDRQLRPGPRDLDVLLLEDDLALLAGDGGGAPLPLDQVVGVGAWGREVALELEPDLGLVVSVAAGPGGDFSYVLGHLEKRLP